MAEPRQDAAEGLVIVIERLLVLRGTDQAVVTQVARLVFRKRYQHGHTEQESDDAVETLGLKRCVVECLMLQFYGMSEHAAEDDPGQPLARPTPVQPQPHRAADESHEGCQLDSEHSVIDSMETKIGLVPTRFGVHCDKLLGGTVK